MPGADCRGCAPSPQHDNADRLVLPMDFQPGEPDVGQRSSPDRPWRREPRRYSHSPVSPSRSVASPVRSGLTAAKDAPSSARLRSGRVSLAHSAEVSSQCEYPPIASERWVRYRPSESDANALKRREPGAARRPTWGLRQAERFKEGRLGHPCCRMRSSSHRQTPSSWRRFDHRLDIHVLLCRCLSPR